MAFSPVSDGTSHYKPTSEYRWTSKALNRDILLRQIGLVPHADLKLLRAEFTDLIESIRAQLEEHRENPETRGEEWARRARNLSRVAGLFNKAVAQELAEHYQILELEKEKEKTRRHEHHQNQCKRLGYLRRSAFDALIRQQLGDEVVEALHERANVIAKAQLEAEQAKQAA